MTLATLALFVVGIAALVLGAELLVRGAVRLAMATGVSPLVIGLTVVSFGTSAPEFAVSLGASLGGQPDLAVGNAVGSNIANVLLILGLSAILIPLHVARQVLRWELPLMIAACALVYVLALDGQLSTGNGALLFSLLILYTGYTVWKSRRDRWHAVEPDSELGPLGEPTGAKALLQQVGLVLAGLVLLVLGSDWLVTAAVSFARAFGVSELVIGLTIVAVGTSLPEIAASVVAALKGERDIAVGNIVGSNLFNMLGVLGLTAWVVPGGIQVAEAALRFDFPVMLLVCLACVPVFYTGRIVARWEGGLFLAWYAIYLAFLVLYSTQHVGLAGFNQLVLAVLVPASALLLVISVLREFGGRNGSASPGTG